MPPKNPTNIAYRPTQLQSYPTDYFADHINHLTKLAKIRKFLHHDLYHQQVRPLSIKINHELKVFRHLPPSSGDAECDTDELLPLTQLAKDLGCSHKDQDDGESCYYRTLHDVIAMRVKAIALLYDEEESDEEV
ncbi:MAG: hypothetical protein Q9168_003537 [Polycauliona sp. 1 TL-2023]